MVKRNLKGFSVHFKYLRPRRRIERSLPTGGMHCEITYIFPLDCKSMREKGKRKEHSDGREIAISQSHIDRDCGCDEKHHTK